MTSTKAVTEYIENAAQWQSELKQLREILNSTGLKETMKWGAPCYTHNGKNVVGIAGFKNYFGLWFHQGALLDDSESVLINAQSGRTKALRQWRFESKKHIKVRTIKAYVKKSIENISAGKSITADRKKPNLIPALLEQALTNSKSAKRAFTKLTKGKQREYAEFISEAKRNETKKRRLAKIMPMIEAGKGLNDHYR